MHIVVHVCCLTVPGYELFERPLHKTMMCVLT